MLQLDNCFSRSEIIQELLKRKRATESLIEFIKFEKDDYQVNWHHELICNEIDQLLNREFELLLVSTPPRFGKTQIVSRHAPAYVLGKNPDSSIIACSYSADLSSRNNRDVQRILDGPKYPLLFPDTRLNLSNVRTTAQGTYLRNSDIFEIVGHKGVYRSCGVGGGITGMGFSGLGVIDDPIKNREESESATIRNKIWEWYTDVFLTRREDNAPILITMTRWNKNDLIGRILDLSESELGTDKVKVITLPAISEEYIPEYDQRTGPDQSLWIEKFPMNVLTKIKNTLPVYSWLSLYQQRPVALSGNLVSESNFKYCTLQNGILTLKDNKDDSLNKSYPLNQCRIFQTCDPAASEKSSADYFALGTWAQTPMNEIALIDLVRDRMEKPKQLPLMRQQFVNWHPQTQWIATKGLGISLYQDLLANGLPVKPFEEETDKVSRFITACDKIEAGIFYILDCLPHKQEYKTELLDFPNGEHDDMVDITSTAIYALVIQPYIVQSYETTYVGEGVSSGGFWI